MELRKREYSALEKVIFAITAVFLAVMLAAYVYWLFTTPFSSAVSVILSAAALLFFSFIGAKAIKDVFYAWRGEPEVDLTEGLGKRSLRQGSRHPILKLFLALLLSRIVVFVVAYIVLLLEKGYEGALLDTLSLWLKGDAPHYMGIADNWYVTEGDPRFHIVFFPLYPILVRFLNYIVQNTFVSGLFISCMSTVIAGMLLYELALLDLDRAAAKRAVKFQMLLPAAFLLNAPMSDGLFLLLSIACMLLARKKKYVLAAALGGLAAFTRVLGVVLLVPVAIELIGDAVRLKKKNGNVLMYALPRAVSQLLIPMGFLFYLLVNHNVTGDAFTFMTYQREHWNQEMGWFFHTISYQTEYFFTKFGSDNASAFGLWLPNLLVQFLSLIVMLLVSQKRVRRYEKPRKRRIYSDTVVEGQGVQDGPKMQIRLKQPYALRPSYMAYFLAYYFASMGATWLLSAPRYLTCCFPLSIALAALGDRRGKTLCMYGALLIMQVLYLIAYVKGWPVY
ncbi:hypothetical protein LJC27_02625 [Christensenellaceae bacterium OttesenSCG-928-M15]|nr:hypothetical protein [Christensenellaceae bacterium OttesenSCG-928-M15]